MYQAKDGKKFGNHEMGKHYDRTRPGAGAGAVGSAASMTGEAHEESDADEKDGHELAEEHGPAQHTEIHSPDKTGDGSHHVHSHHEDGHHHVSKGHDLESAHEHSKAAMGGGEHEEKESESEREAEGEGDKEPMGLPGMD